MVHTFKFLLFLEKYMRRELISNCQLLISDILVRQVSIKMLLSYSVKCDRMPGNRSVKLQLHYDMNETNTASHPLPYNPILSYHLFFLEEYEFCPQKWEDVSGNDVPTGEHATSQRPWPHMGEWRGHYPLVPVSGDGKGNVWNEAGKGCMPGWGGWDVEWGWRGLFHALSCAMSCVPSFSISLPYLSSISAKCLVKNQEDAMEQWRLFPE